MGRPERPIDLSSGPLAQFAGELRELRQSAGGLSYRRLARRANYSATALSEAAGGEHLPSLAVTLGYVAACDGDVQHWERRWRSLVADLAAAAGGTAPAGDADQCPYLGLVTFEPADSDRFFGRDSLVAELLSRLSTTPFLAVFGASGSGKSSLLRAGLLPAITAGGLSSGGLSSGGLSSGGLSSGGLSSGAAGGLSSGAAGGPLDSADRTAVLLTPGEHPIQALARALATEEASAGAVARQLGDDPLSVATAVEQVLATRSPGARLVIVVDQFEELFTLCRDETERRCFIDALLAAGPTAGSRAVVVVGIRADFYARCSQHPPLISALRDRQILIGPMDEDELRAAITGPAQRTGLTVEPGLVATILADVRGEPGALPLVSHALLETWLRRDGDTLTLTGYRDAGGVRGAIAQTADRVYGGLHANQVVSGDQIVEALWGGAPPPTARAQLHALVAAVRRSLRDAGVPDALTTRAGGYTLNVAPDDCDLHLFESLVRQARAATDTGPETAELLRSALRLWRGTALEGASGAYVESSRARLEEHRLGVQEQLLDIDLAQGRHSELVPELTALVAAHPLRERLVGQLMLALYRCGRQAEALQAGRELRRTLAEEEGLDPGPQLAKLETAILRADPSLELPAPPAGPVAVVHEPAGAEDRRIGALVRLVPRQLPADVDAFVGRDEELATLDAVLAEQPDGSGGAPPVPRVALLHGGAGTGKSALAVHWAHRSAGRFPDGQLYLDLRGSAPDGPLSRAEVVDEALRAFGIPADQLPRDDTEALAAYHSLLRSRRMLVILDDVGPEPAPALLPDGGRCVVLATSRQRVTLGVPAQDITVPELPPADAVRLLGTVAGRPADSHGLAAIAQSCAGHPLALTLLGRHLADAGDAALSAVADRLGTADADQPEARALTYVCAGIGADRRRLLRLLGAAPIVDVTPGAAAALMDCPVPQAQALLADLADRAVLRRHPADRFSLHPALRAPAAATETDGGYGSWDGDGSGDGGSGGSGGSGDGDGGDAAATARMCAYYLYATDTAARLLYPHSLRLPMPAGDAPVARLVLADHTQAFAWLEAERVNLVRVIGHAAAQDPRPVAWLLADALRGYFALSMRTRDWALAAETALAAAKAAGADDAQSAAHLSLAELHLRHSRQPGAWQETWAVLAATGATRPATAPVDGSVGIGERYQGTGRRPRSTTARVLLTVLTVLLVCGTAAASVPAGLSDETVANGPAAVVLRSSVSALRLDESIDFDDGGRLRYDRDAGIDMSPWGSGNHLSGKNGATLALLPPGASPSYRSCAAIRVSQREHQISGLHAVPDGQRICLWTAPGRVVLLTLRPAPRQQRPDVEFDYVVYQGTAPKSRQVVPPVPAETEVHSFSLSDFGDRNGLDIDPGGGGRIPKEGPGVDVSANTKANNLKTGTGSLIAVLRPGSPGTYQACTAVPPDQRTVVVVDLHDKAVGQKMCLYAFSGRVALLTMSRVPSPSQPVLHLNVRVWQGTYAQDSASDRPPPWIRGPYSPEKRTQCLPPPDSTSDGAP